MNRIETREIATPDSKSTAPYSNEVHSISNMVDHKFLILSWNIHDSIDGTEGPKINDKEFTRILARDSIFCLQETKGKVNLQDYKCYNSLRSGSRSGGICVGIHRALTGEFKEHDTNSADFQAISIKIDAFEQLGRFTLINMYDPLNKDPLKPGPNSCPPSPSQPLWTWYLTSTPKQMT